MTAVSFDPSVFDTPEYWRNPYPHLKVLRDHFPLYHDDMHGLWYITRYDDVVNAFKDNVHYSSKNLERSMALVFGTTMMQFDGEEHTKRRNIVAPEFSGRRMEPLIPIIEKNTQDLVDRITAGAAERLARGFADEGEVELIDAFSSRLPVMVIIDMLGLPQEDHDLFHEWYPAMMAGLTGTPEQRTYGIECNQQFHAYIDRLVDERSVNPGEDLISKLCIAEVDGARMSKEDIKAFSSLLLVAGGETTDKAIGNMWVHMMENPDQFAEVKRDPDLFDRVFTETMRITPPAGSQSRDVVKPVELYGQTIPVGAMRRTSRSSGRTTTSACSTTRTSSTSSGTTSTSAASCAQGISRAARPGTSASGWGSTSAWATSWRGRRRSLGRRRCSGRWATRA